MRFVLKIIPRVLPSIFLFSLPASATIIDTARYTYVTEVTHPEIIELNNQIPINERRTSVVSLKKPIRLSSTDNADWVALKACQDTHPTLQGVTDYTVLIVSIFGRTKIREYFSILSISCIGPKTSKIN